ncbi:hypothetical protein AAG747_06185 [Rapidithrix thailandica]|uniref:Uncharacterized protein n=1 Tax=Rapidithrix thailandica TaxID=413964 RepID=A0AAW9S324_9BACT
MNSKEKNLVFSWMEELNSVELSVGEDGSNYESNEFWGINNSNNQRDEEKEARVREELEKANYIKQLEKIMLEEPVNLIELKANINANFILIEDAYEEEFVDLGVEYKTYQEAHPKGDYSQARWVEEKSQQLQLLKKKEFEKLKAQLFSGE